MSGTAGWKGVEPGWAQVDALIEATLVREDAALAACRRRSGERGLPDIAVSAAQGAFLQLLAQVTGAGRVLEVGTLGGYSTIWLARGVGEGGEVISLEVDPGHAETARENLREAGLAAAVTVITGAALETLPTLEGPFDLAFIDADKVNNAAYVEHAVRLSRPGALVIVDNVVREGRILDASADEAARATRALYDRVAVHPRLEATVLQTVGNKGWDGLMLARVRG